MAAVAHCQRMSGLVIILAIVNVRQDMDCQLGYEVFR